MDRVKTNICYTQEDIFKYYAQKGYDVKSFTNLYLKSSFCENKFDTFYSRYQYETARECADFINPEIEDKLTKANNKQNVKKAGFIGFIYRLLYYATGIESKKLIDIIPFEAVERKYTISQIRTEDLIVMDLCENYNLKIVDDKLSEMF